VDQLRPISDVLAEADERLTVGESAAAKVWPTGFPVLDMYLAGGLRSGELTLLGGPQGLGKTSLVLQILRHTVSTGGVGVYFSFEHDAPTVLQRLIAVEAAETLGLDSPQLKTIRAAMEAQDGSAAPLAERLSAIGAHDAVQRIATYGDRLLVHRSTGSTTDVDQIREIALEVSARTEQPPILIVDYLQKVALKDHDGDEMERVTLIVESLKDLALELDLPVLAIVAADKEGLVTGKRLRINNLRGSSALAYEPDVVLIMNEKYDVVARHHLVYDVGNAERFHNWAVITIEKNRSGPDRVDIEFLKRFDQGRFDVDGRRVNEQLVDERVFTE
jgi:replicative DNA helicase